ncbi:MAG: hypothetical protein A3E87_05555 [Gammaproteobacteria bacterium RIFCSPHIGHO2_12_FULL_35_23]|nr:MAG: hypothetical protein A3E87_05555 [Gammaproteobacteria bacterium RIFCSPHIGHO2_12_FULL_35_23]
MFEAIKYEFHHLGIPTQELRKNERYSSVFKVYTSDDDNKKMHIQWHRFEKDSPIHPLIQTIPHLGFKVSNLERALSDKKVILQPYSPFEGFKVAFIEKNGVPIELIETQLSEEEVWSFPKKNSFIYSDNRAQDYRS